MVIDLAGNEFSNKPPDVRPLPADIVQARARFGFDKLPVTEIRAPQEPAAAPPDRRPPPERTLDRELPPATVGRAAYERSPVHQLEKVVEKQGFSPEAFRQQLREHPEMLPRGVSSSTAELFADFARVGTVPHRRFALPASAEVDALVHKAVGKPADDYVSQRDLDGLLKTITDHRDELARKGFSAMDVDRVRSYLVKETGRVPTGDLPGPRTVTTSDGHLGLTEQDAVLHDRWRAVNAGVEAPLTTARARQRGAELDEVERWAHGASAFEHLVGTCVLHTAGVRAGITAAERPAGPPRIVQEAPARSPELAAGPRGAPEGPATPSKATAGPPDSGSYAKELFNLRDRSYELALEDAREGKATLGRQYDATGFGRRVHVHFGELADQAIREGRLPSTFVVNVQDRLSPKHRGLDAWDKATGVGFDVTTATTRSVLSHEKHVGVPAVDGTHIHEYLPLVYPTFKETEKTLGYD